MIDPFLSYSFEVEQFILSTYSTDFSPNSNSLISDRRLAQIIGASPENSTPKDGAKPTGKVSPFVVFPVGLNLPKRNVITSSLVRGLEEKGQAVDFKNWLISFDDLVKILEIKVRILNDGKLELQSPGFIVRISPQQLTQDPELGLTIQVEKIESLLGVPVSFDATAYAIIFAPSWLDARGILLDTNNNNPVVLEGLPRIEAPDLSFSAIGINYQSIGTSDSFDGVINTINNQSQLLSVGTLLEGSWFVNIAQNNLEDWTTWSLRELQYLVQTPQADYAIGSQSSFWDLQDGSDYWGVTTIQRFGFIPPVAETIYGDQSGGFLPFQRLQSNQLNRSIAGKAPPGTLVQLRRANAKNAIAEVLVDESGSYSFKTENKISNPQGISSSGQMVTYQLFLYPGGQRTEEPEIREVKFLLLPLLLPTGSSAILSSVGIGRDFLDQGFFGDFTHLKGGIGYFYGVSEDLTLGTGIIQDGGTLPSATLIYQPNSIPLGLNFTSLFGTDNKLGWGYSAGLSYFPTSDITLNLNTSNLSQDRFTQSFQFTWRMLPNFSWRLGGNDRDKKLLVGFNFSQKIDQLFVSTGINYDTQSNILWQGTFGLDKWKLTTFGGGVNNSFNGVNNNRFYSNSELSYNFNQWYGTGHAIFLNYNTDYNGSDSNDYLSAGWRYQSSDVTYDYRPLWLFDLGYGVGNAGSGIVASLGTNVIPGTTIRATYRQTALASNRDDFLIQIFPSFSVQPELTLGDRRFQNLRTRGGLWIQPFLDKNNSGILDAGEQVYTETARQLLTLDNRSLKNYAGFNTTDQAIILQVLPGNYRLDLDPAGYPIDYQPMQTAYAVEVVAGSYTTVPIPFIPSYTVGGKVVDKIGKAIAGARVEAISNLDQKTVISITDGEGTFYLENLQQGVYKIQVNGKETEPNQLIINADSLPLFELNLIADAP
ncbi:MAG: carboxypeptidase regulatory-like domain-containing protein [Microcystaceae cyanobacterium]